MNNNGLESSLELDIGPFRQALSAANAQIKQFAGDMKNSLRDAMSSINGAQGGMGRFSNEVRNANSEVRKLGMGMRDLERIVGGILLSQAFYGVKTGIEDAAASLVTFMNDMEKSQIALEYFLATPEQAGAFLRDMQDFAADTAFNTNQSIALSRKLMAAQFDPNSVKGVMTILNDASAAAGGTAEQMDRIVLAISQIKTNGKLAGQEMRQLAEAGIPIYKIIEEELGLTGEQVMNVGDLKIPGEEAVEGILRGLERRYKGAADRIADTMSGMWQTIVDDSKLLGAEIFAAPYAAMKRFLTIWRDTWDEARELMFEGGLGRVLEEMIPKELWSSIRAISGSIKSLGRSFVTLIQAIKPVMQLLAGGLISALGIAMPILAALARAISQLAYAATNSIPGVKYLAAAVLGLMVASGVAKVMMFFWGVLRLGFIAGAVAKSVNLLAVAIARVSMAIFRNPIVLGITAMVAAILYFTGALKNVVGWIDALLNRLSGLGGFDLDLQLPNADKATADIEKYASALGQAGEAAENADGIGGAGDDADDAGKKAGKAAKEFKKFTASFDELYQVPEQNDDSGSGSGDKDKKPGGGAGGLPSLDTGPGSEFDPFKLPDEIELPKLKWPALEDIPWPIPIAKLLGGGFKWPEWPKFPPFPPLPQLEWSIPWETVFSNLRVSWDANLNWVKGAWGTALEWVGSLQFPPITIPKPNFGPILEGLTTWFPTFQASWKTYWESLPWPDWKTVLNNVFQPIPLALGTLATATSLMFEDMAANFQTSMDKLATSWEGFAQWFTTGWSTVFEVSSDYLGQIGGAISKAFDDWVTDAGVTFGAIGVAFLLLWQTLSGHAKTGTTNLKKAFSETWTNISTNVKSFITTMATSFATFLSTLGASWTIGWDKLKSTMSTKLGEMKSFWDKHKTTVLIVVGALLAGIALAFTGGLSGVLAGAIAWGPRLVKFFKDLLPLIGAAIKGLPGKFTTIWNTITKAVPGIVSAIVKPFNDIPSKIFNAVKGVGAKFKEAFANIKLPSFTEAANGVSATFRRLGDVAGFETGGIIGKDSIVRVGEKGKREAIIPLQNATAMQPFVDAVVRGMGGVGNNNNGGSGDDRPIVHVGTLIADERGLRELEQKLEIVRRDRGGRTT